MLLLNQRQIDLAGLPLPNGSSAGRRPRRPQAWQVNRGSDNQPRDWRHALLSPKALDMARPSRP